MYIIQSTKAAFALTIAISGSAVADQRTLYKLGLRDIDGIILDGSTLYVALSLSQRDGGQHVQLIKLKASGGSGCNTSKYTEMDNTTVSKSCVKLKRANHNNVRVDIHTKFTYNDMKYGDKSADWDFLKGYDFVRERKYSINLQYAAESCSAEVTSRSYIPVDGEQPSRTGPQSCRIERG